MNQKQALSILKPAAPTQAALKAAYREAALKSHPDRGGSVEQMQLVNLAYETLTQFDFWWTASQAREAASTTPLTETIQNILNQIRFPGIKAELIGSWLWVSGNTYPYRKELKDAGLKFSRNKQSWYFHEGAYQKRSKKRYNMSEIRNLHGSQDVELNGRARLAA